MKQETPFSSIDLGCGRGEMLDFCQDLGYEVLGIDSNQAAVRRCEQKGFRAICSDLLQYIQREPSANYNLITSIHVIEHCPAKYIYQLLKECYRTLKPRGAILLETPSLYSLWTSGRQFYLDPTHQFPIHPELIKFMVEDIGFSNFELLSFEEVDTEEAREFRQQHGKGKVFDWLFGSMDLGFWIIK